MEVLRRFADAAPAATTFEDIKPTLIMSWWCTLYAIAIILFRVCGRYIRVEKLLLEDIIMLASIVLLFTRTGLAHAVLIDGTNNTVLDGLTSAQISTRVLGSKLVIGSRIMYAL